MATANDATLDDPIELDITRLPISVPCPIPVLPGTFEIDATLEQRTELCHVDAWWMVGAAPICDVHFRIMCTMTGTDYEGCIAELKSQDGMAGAEIPNWLEAQPWSEMCRYPQPGANVVRVDRFVDGED